MPSPLVLHQDTNVRVLMEKSTSGARQVDGDRPECGIVLGECRSHWSTRLGETRKLDLFPGDVWCCDGGKQEGGYWTRPIHKMIIQFLIPAPNGLSNRFGAAIRQPADGFSAFLSAIAAFGVSTEATERFGREAAIAAFIAYLQSNRSERAASGHEITSRRLGRVRDYVDAHLGDTITLADMASAAALSQAHFSRSFRRATGLTPYAYVLDQRLQRAMRLLEAGNSVGSAAADAGFGSSETLRRHFLKRFGIPPGKWTRRQI